MARNIRPRRPAAPPTLAPRSTVWTGQLRLVLVTVPVILVPATRGGAHIALHQVHKPSGKRVHYDKIVPGLGSVKPDDIGRGVEVSKGHYVLLEDSELDHLKLEAKRNLDLVQFVDHDDIDPIWYERPYYVLPDGDLAEEPYGVIRDALRASRKIGIGQFVMRGRDYVAALKPCGNGISLETLRFADEVQDGSKIFASVVKTKPEKDLLDLAVELIQRKSTPFEPAAFHDRYTEALRDLVAAHAKKQKPLEIADDAPPDSGAKVIDLVEALKRSVRAAEAPAPPAAKRGKAK
jgi:DNA end-binding protein Ku